MVYNHKEIEPKWQKYWADHHTFKTGTDASKPKFYALDIFPYPSGADLLHMDTQKATQQQISLAVSNVPKVTMSLAMGWDAFGFARRAIRYGYRE